VPAELGTVVCGHTHMPFVRLVDRCTVVNPGSIGMPYGSVGAHWALLGGAPEPSISLRRTHYDVRAAAEEIAAKSTFPDIEEWVDFFLRRPASDLEALTVFGPRDGRRGQGSRSVATMDITVAGPIRRPRCSTPSARNSHFW